MAVSLSFPFTTDTNYTFGSTVEVTGGVGKLKDQSTPYQTSTNATCLACFLYNEDLNWGNGVLTGALAGGATVSGNELDVSGFSGKSWYVDAEYNADSAQTGCINILFTPQYTGSPSSNSFIVSNNKADASTNNMIQIVHLTSGVVLVSIYDSTGAAILNTSLASWSPASGTEYEFSLNYDITAGATRLFIDGTQLGATSTATGTRTAGDINRLTLGTASAGTEGCDNIYGAIIVYDQVQHTTDYTTTGLTGIPCTTYATDNPTLTIGSTIRNEGLGSFEATSTLPGSDLIKATLSKGATPYYVSGGTWGVSNADYTQTSAPTEINTDIATFNTEATDTEIVLYLHSEDGSTTPEIDLLTISFNYRAPVADTVETCIVYGYNYDALGAASTETIAITLNGDAIQYKTDTVLQQTSLIITPDSDGYWEAELIENENMETGSSYNFDFGDKDYNVIVPNEESIKFWDLGRL